MNVAEALQRGLRLQQAGKLAEAAEIYRDIVRARPDSADAWNLLGVVFYAGGAFEQAVLMADQAIDLQPDFFAPYANKGNALQALGRLAEAVDAFQKAVALQPDSAEVHNNLASALNALGRHREAADACVRALTQRPDFPEVHNNLGNALIGLGEIEDAARSYRRALELRPNFADALYNLGGALVALERFAEAAQTYRTAIVLDPKRPETHYNLANALRAAGDLEEAAASYRNALGLRADYADALNNLAATEQAMGHLDVAEDLFRKALAGDPKRADLHWNLSLVLLQKGDLAEGFREYEWRWRNPAFTSPRREFAQPQWDGGPLAGKTILLHAEQGLGDAIQFARFIPLVAQRGGRVVLECRRPLVRLLATVAEVAKVVPAGEPLPPFDCHLPLMSLPMVLGTTLETVPVTVPYLAAPRKAATPERLAAAAGLKVGIAWAGSRTRALDRFRSCAVADLEALFGIPGVTLFSLQVGEATTAAAPFVDKGLLVDLGSSFRDFADTAAAVAGLDAVVSVDTAVAHLAGALARPTFVMLSFASGYLWMTERTDSPWYPTARLFRQTTRTDWSDVVARVRSEIERLAAPQT